MAETCSYDGCVKAPEYVIGYHHSTKPSGSKPTLEFPSCQVHLKENISGRKMQCGTPDSLIYIAIESSCNGLLEKLLRQLP